MTDLDRILRDLASEGSRNAGHADPTEIRKAGDTRRRRRIASGVAAIGLAVVAAVGTAVGVSALPSREIPVTPANPMATPANTPSPQHHTLADDPFLPGPYGWPNSYQDLNRIENIEDFRDFCLPAMDTLGAAEVAKATYSGQIEGMINSAALEFDSATDAEAAVADLRDLPDSCYAEPEEDRDTIVHDPRDRDAGDEAYVFAYESIPNEKNPGSGTSYFGYGVVREANVVVVIEFGGMSMPVADKPYATWTTEQLNEMIHRAIG